MAGCDDETGRHQRSGTIAAAAAFVGAAIESADGLPGFLRGVDGLSKIMPRNAWQQWMIHRDLVGRNQN